MDRLWRSTHYLSLWFPLFRYSYCVHFLSMPLHFDSIAIFTFRPSSCRSNSLTRSLSIGWIVCLMPKRIRSGFIVCALPISCACKCPPNTQITKHRTRIGKRKGKEEGEWKQQSGKKSESKMEFSKGAMCVVNDSREKTENGYMHRLSQKQKKPTTNKW